MNYFAIIENNVTIALMASIGLRPMIPLHEPKTMSYFDNKKVRPISLEKFNSLRNKDDGHSYS